MDEKYLISKNVKNTSYALMAIGVLSIAYAFYVGSDRAWANLLLNNYYFIAISIGATFYYAIQYITQSGWSAQFQRIPLAISSYLPVAAILFLVLLFGMNSLYSWVNPNTEELKELIEHKEPFLNIPFFAIRMVIYFSLWIFMTRLLKKTALKEDQKGGLENFNKSELYSKIYIFILAISFSLFTFDAIMSLNIAWYSTLFAIKNFVSAFYHGTAVIIIIVIFLNKKGYYKSLTSEHMHSFSKYLFILSILWVYLWFFQYLVIWFGNIEEDVLYFINRKEGSWNNLFILNIILNWTIPFFVLLTAEAKQNKKIVSAVCLLLLVGMYVDLYLQIIPDTTDKLIFGVPEIGTYLGFLGLFIFIVSKGLSKMPIIPKNHPYLNESIEE